MENLGPRLQLARDLVAHLEAGNQSEADQLVEQMARERENSLFMQVGRLARDVHDTLKGLNFDERIGGLAEHDLPDARRRLHYVIQKTAEAANRTLTAVETMVLISEEMGKTAARIGTDWTRFTHREMGVAEFRQLSERVAQFLEDVQDRNSAIQKGLSEVLISQDFQDLTGQVIGRVITLVTEVEHSLVDLIRGARLGAGQNHADQDAWCANGSDVEDTRQRAGHVDGQDEVDALLSSLGF